MKSEISIAIIALSVGWSMHASISKHFCFRCIARSYTLKFAKLALKPMPKFCAQLIFGLGMSATLLFFIHDVARVFGYKQLFQFVQSIIKARRLQNVRKEA